jgi:hypothetical protein
MSHVASPSDDALSSISKQSVLPQGFALRLREASDISNVMFAAM